MFEKLSGEVDTMYYIGEISRKGYDHLTETCKLLKKSNNHKKAIVFLITSGGNPHMGFRIARALQHYYEDGFSVVIPSSCKSAGTLVCLGAKELIIADTGELGPLDIQLSKATELFEQTSGLDLPQAMSALRASVTETIREVLIEVRMGGRLSTKIASEIATNVTTGVYAPIYAQIDPLRLGELHRATMIAYEYGKKLSDNSDNLKTNALQELIMDYPSHGFVIDRKEAKTIFKKVRSPNDEELDIIENLSNVISAFQDQTLPRPVVCFPGMKQSIDLTDELDIDLIDESDVAPSDDSVNATDDSEIDSTNDSEITSTKETTNDYQSPEHHELPASEGVSGNNEESNAGARGSSKKSSENSSRIDEKSDDESTPTVP